MNFRNLLNPRLTWLNHIDRSGAVEERDPVTLLGIEPRLPGGAVTIRNAIFQLQSICGLVVLSVHRKETAERNP